MRAYIIRRLLMMIPTLLLATLLIFFMVRLIPGDIIDAMQAVPGQDEELDRAAIERALGLDAPAMVQYGRWLGAVPQVDGGFSGILQGNLHPDHVMIGRALTATFVALRPDLSDVVKAQGEREGRPYHQSMWVTDSVVEGEVIVADLFGKVRQGAFVGDNMATGVAG